CDESFADVISRERAFEVLRQAGRLRVGINRSRERRAESGEVRATVYGVDIVGKGIDLLVVAVVILNRDFDREVIVFLFEVDRLVVQRRLVLVQVLYELGDAALVIELVRPLRLLTLVFDRDADALVEKRLLTQPL